jgi:hypothetical protein
LFYSILKEKEAPALEDAAEFHEFEIVSISIFFKMPNTFLTFGQLDSVKFLKHALFIFFPRINNILEKKFIPRLEFHYYECSVLGLLDEVQSKLDVWNVKYGNKESVELLLEDWRVSCSYPVSWQHFPCLSAGLAFFFGTVSQ